MCTWPNATESSIVSALRHAGFQRWIVHTKSSISEKNWQLWLIFTHEHLNWTSKQWSIILWTDETWVLKRIHRRIWVSIWKDKKFDPTVIVECEWDHRGWMFWDCFNGTIKKPCVFWEKNWGHIDQDSYIEHIVSVLDNWLQQHLELSFIQDNASDHKKRKTQTEILKKRCKESYDSHIHQIWILLRKYEIEWRNILLLTFLSKWHMLS